MQRLSQRARTDFSVRTKEGRIVSQCRGIEVSASGILIDRGRRVADRDHPFYLELEIRLPERIVPMRAMARPVWAFGTQQAFKFIHMSDADRLTIAEHVDLQARRQHILN